MSMEMLFSGANRRPALSDFVKAYKDVAASTQPDAKQHEEGTPPSGWF